MRRLRRSLVLTALLVTVLVATAAGCAEGQRLTPPGSLARELDLTGQTLTVGGKEFAEQLLLCKMTIALLQSTGATVVDRCDTKGSANVRAALATGQIDMYWEYTGTAWRTYLSQESTIADPRALYDAVKEADAGNRITWLDPTPFNNTYALGVRTDTAQRLRVRTISDFAALVRSGSPEATLCVDQEFTGREDGLQGLLATYGITLGDQALDTREIEEIYPAIAAANPCTFGEVFATDGRLNPLRLSTLVDDRGYFLPYNAALTVRTDVMERAPRLALLGRMLAPTLTEQVMRGLNERVSAGGRSADEVARGFLREQGLIG
ncbi:glycine/betaine ABC transporter substrate-binding protein [Actinomycetospora sp. NBRC 106375]|uniref:glycine betaine ABC transporter substrate-binding protein n=1 Tax=Actinomycetospora sp. NBRC 106375 TaxID=3032207 RepID=UPI0024A5D13F|nr:glycine betaine ABC transporter substrate-binding protein [Actinomycetospora sp. NBRC 106375]GLZ46459.1 glycine/betaine ABC transporter substrate-binding protein [Actinomycetospora sp. NBRC 106375]